MIKENLEFCFKGERTYVQGPDIFDAAIVKLSNYFDLNEISSIKYAAHDMLKKNAFMIIVEKFQAEDYETINSIITFKYENKSFYVVVVENENYIECATVYSEETIRTKSIIKDKKIEFQNNLEDSLTEIIVSMNKYYLQETVTKDGKWIVTKFDYKNLTDIQNITDKNISLELKNNFNNKLTKSIILIDGLMVGHLYFSMI